LQSYDRKTTALKNLYQEEVTEDAEEYNSYGWILSDHGPNIKDGKQLSHITFFLSASPPSPTIVFNHTSNHSFI
jgi:hypothetical protein